MQSPVIVRPTPPSKQKSEYGMGKKSKKPGRGKEKTERKTAKAEEKKIRRESKKVSEEDDIDAILVISHMPYVPFYRLVLPFTSL